MEELIANAIIHGYGEDKSGFITLEAAIFERGLMIRMEEKGVKFDPLSVAEPDLDADLTVRRKGGLGLFIVKQVMDEVYYEQEGDGTKRFTLIKRVRS